jgi:muramidase (phage lysozyme)
MLSADGQRYVALYDVAKNYTAEDWAAGTACIQRGRVRRRLNELDALWWSLSGSEQDAIQTLLLTEYERARHHA